MCIDDDSNEREDRALDALIVLALRKDLRAVYLDDLDELDDLEDPLDLDGPEPVLSAEDERALDALGPDLAERIARQYRESGA
jgi:hypothetical protein